MNRYQEIANESYPDGCVEMAAGDPIAGDGLARFIARELSDDEECDSLDTAIQRMETAKDELSTIVAALWEEGERRARACTT